jgi:hypothetical protein
MDAMLQFWAQWSKSSMYLGRLVRCTDMLTKVVGFPAFQPWNFRSYIAVLYYRVSNLHHSMPIKTWHWGLPDLAPRVLNVGPEFVKAE